jgi:hypothetical protein
VASINATCVIASDGGGFEEHEHASKAAQDKRSVLIDFVCAASLKR